MRRVVVTGMGIISCIGNTLDEVVTSLREARSGITFDPEMAEHNFSSRVSGRPVIDVKTRVDRKKLRFMGDGAAWNYIAMEDAIGDAGLEPNEVSHERTGLIMGSGGPSTKTLFAADTTVINKGGTRHVGPFAVPACMSSTNSATLAVPFHIHGVNYSISSACATSAHCIGNAVEMIQWGKQDVMFAGGGEELDWTLSCLFDAMGAMSSRFNDTPEKTPCAYDMYRDGFVIAGGAGVLVLEELGHAKARGAKIYAEVTGYGLTSDGFDMVQPSGEGAVRCMRMALQEINGLHNMLKDGDSSLLHIAPERKITYINTHGTATVVGDEREMGAVRTVFGKNVPLLSSTKPLSGHSLGATGAQEAIYSILMMREGFVCESAKITELDPEFEGLPIVQERVDNVEFDTVLSNSFGFGGTNCSLAFSRFDQ